MALRFDVAITRIIELVVGWSAIEFLWSEGVGCRSHTSGSEQDIRTTPLTVIIARVTHAVFYGTLFLSMRKYSSVKSKLCWTIQDSVQ